MEVGRRGRLYTNRYSHHQNDTCIKMGSDEGPFNVLLIVKDKVARQCPEITTFLLLFLRERRRAESESSRGPSAYHPND